MVRKTKKIIGRYIYGINPVVEVLKAKRRKVFTLYTTKPVPKAWKQIELLRGARPITINYTTRPALEKMVGTPDHQGVVALVQPFAYRKKPFDSKKQPFLLLLDGIQDVRNLGAILRSAYCTGVDGIILPKKNSAPLNATAFKASAGYAEYLEIYQPTSSGAAAQELSKDKYTLYLATFGGTDVTKVDFQKPLCLVIGAEGAGLSSQLLTYGTKVTLPQSKKAISYNASVAAGILLFLVAYTR